MGVEHASKHIEVVVSDPRGRCAPVDDDVRSRSEGTLKGVDTRCRKFPYPFCAEDVRSVRSGLVCAPKVRLNGSKAVVSKSLLYRSSECAGRGVPKYYRI